MIIRIDYPQPQVRLDLWGGTSGTFSGFDRFGRVTDQRWTRVGGSSSSSSSSSSGGSGLDVDRYGYEYDRDSNRLWKQNVVSASAGVPLDELYTYDNLNRLATMQRGTLNAAKTAITGTPVLEQDWTLDPTGNWRGYQNKTGGTTDLNQARSASPVNEITGVSNSVGAPWVQPAYDAAGNTTTFPKGDDPTQGLVATYDAWNRMTEVRKGPSTGSSSSSSSSSGSAPLVAKYSYDGRNRRVVNQSYTAGSLTETRQVYYTSNWQDVEERVGSATTADTQYVWGLRYIDELVCRDAVVASSSSSSSGSSRSSTSSSSGSGPGTQRIYATQDANFNVTGLLGSSGSVLQRFVYEPYGEENALTSAWSITPILFGWSILFGGVQRLTDVNLVYMRNRIYEDLLGRFHQRDSQIGRKHILMKATSDYLDGPNLYEFAKGMPTQAVDPFGTQVWTVGPRPCGPACTKVETQRCKLRAQALGWYRSSISNCTETVTKAWWFSATGRMIYFNVAWCITCLSNCNRIYKCTKTFEGLLGGRKICTYVCKDWPAGLIGRTYDDPNEICPQETDWVKDASGDWDHPPGSI